LVIAQQIQDKIRQGMAFSHLDIINESHKHNVPPGSESHFKVVIVSEAFVGKRPVARHQLLYRLLAEELDGPVHALALHTYTVEEWQEVEEQFPPSPNCLGGSKKEQSS